MVNAQTALSRSAMESSLPTIGGSFVVPMTGHGIDADARLVPAVAHEALDLPAAWPNAGYIEVVNNDPEHSITLGVVSGGVYTPVIWIPPRCRALFGAATKNLYWKAETADCWAQFVALER